MKLGIVNNDHLNNSSNTNNNNIGSANDIEIRPRSSTTAQKKLNVANSASKEGIKKRLSSLFHYRQEGF